MAVICLIIGFILGVYFADRVRGWIKDYVEGK